MKHSNSLVVFARLVLLVLTLAITVFTFASCDGLPPELQGLLGGNPNESCEHAYDNACDTDCNTCGATRETEHAYDNACDTDCNVCGATRETEHAYADGVCGVCGAADESLPTCEHTTVENCVCKDCGAPVHINVEHMPATPPDCDMPGIIECYGCYDCSKLFSDAECKNEITLDDVLIPERSEHRMVGGICEFCCARENYTDGDPNGGHVPTVFDLAVQELYAMNPHAWATLTDYELVSKIVVEGKEFRITWVIANESITLTYDETRDVYLVDIPDDIPEEYGDAWYYSVVATISDSDGWSEEHLFAKVLRPN